MRDRKLVVREFNDSEKRYMTTKDLKNRKLSSYDIEEMCLQGSIARIKRGLYMINEGTAPESALNKALRCVPNGVLCLHSALAYHGITGQIPAEIMIAVPHKAKKPVIPKDLRVKLYYFTENRYSIGKTIFYEDNVTVYDMEKTICDIVYYRNKIDQELVKTSLQNYLKSEQKDLDKLLRYADELRVGKILRNYLEVLI